MSKNNKANQQMRAFQILAAVVVVGTIGAIAIMKYAEANPGIDQVKLDRLAQCLTEKGAKMYGAVWCGHCQEQKKAFGKAFSKIDYVECAVPGNPRAQAQECEEAGVTSYPTWIFGDGSQASGYLELTDLAERAGCPFDPEEGQTANVAPGITLNEGVTEVPVDKVDNGSVMLDLGGSFEAVPSGSSEGASGE